MKCPKCGYLGFETVDRCRNCGYDFSLTPAPVPDLPIRSTNSDRPLSVEDLPLTPADHRGSADRLRSGNAPRAASLREPSAELPLFGSRTNDDTPLITHVSPPRTPLGVRRATPEVPRLRTEARPSLLDQAEPDVDEAPTRWRPSAPAPAARPPAASVLQLEGASLVARAGAGIIDLLVLLLVDAVVVYFTLQICGLTVGEIALLPMTPLVTFLVIQDLGYFAAFTAGGQTLGKMVTGIQVIAEGSDRAPALSSALLRTGLWLLLALPAGLGLVTVLLDAEKRGLHDRFARTRVVRAASSGIG